MFFQFRKIFFFKICNYRKILYWKLCKNRKILNHFIFFYTFLDMGKEALVGGAEEGLLAERCELLLDESVPFFSLKLVYEQDEMVSATLNGQPVSPQS